MGRTFDGRGALLCVVLFVSGAATLVFENLWFRLAGLAFGNGVWAAALVIGGFMTGLALGNAWAARYGEGIRNPLRFYGVLEFLIGGTGLGLVLLLPWLEVWLTPLYQALHAEAEWALFPLRLVGAFLVFLVPTTAMGATLPMVVRGLYARDAHYRRVLGRLYGCNTLGAMAGVLAAEVVLVGAFGIEGAAWVAATMNFVAGGAAVLLGRGTGTERPTATQPTAAEAQESARSVAGLFVAAGLSGFLLLALEVVWFRQVQMVYHSTTLVFAVLLALVLGGIALGSFLSSLGAKARVSLPGIALACAISAAAPYLLFDVIFLFLNGLGFSPEGRFGVLSAVLILPASVMSGVLFTRLGAALQTAIGGVGRTTGLLTLANTLGAALGPLAGGFLFLPVLGMDKSFLAVVGGYGLIALCVSAEGGTVGARTWVKGVYGVALVLLVFGRTEERQLRLVDGLLPDAVRVARRIGPLETAVYYRHDRYGAPFSHRLVANNFSMSSTDPRSKRYMQLYVNLPVALHPGMTRGLLIGFGVGSTAKALTNTAEFEQIDIVDISRETLELSEVVFPKESEHPLHDPRVRVHVDDGRFFLRAAGDRYDLITSEPPPPKNAGVVNLYSEEYFQLAHDRLAPGGMMTHWLPVYQMDLKEAKAIAKAFLNVFSDATLWEGGGLNWMLMGTPGFEGPGTMARFSAQFEDGVVGPALSMIGLEDPAQLGATFIGDAAFLVEWTDGVPPLRDNFPQRLSTDMMRGRDKSHLFAEVADAGAWKRFAQSELIARWWPEDLISATAPYFAYQRMLENILGRKYRPNAPDPVADLRFVLSNTDLVSLPIFLLGLTPLECTAAAEMVAAGGTSVRGDARYAAGCKALAERRYGDAAALFQRVVTRPGGFDREQANRMYLLARELNRGR